MSVLKFDDVSFSYAGSEEKVLKHVNFEIEYGEFVLLCGKSGCGKSTLLKHCKKNQIPVGKGSGLMYFEGEDIELMDDRKSAEDIGYVGQNPDGQIVTDKVWHELAFGLESLGTNIHDMHRMIAEMAEYFGISHWFEKPTDELSSGQKQILNLASVMVMRPKLLILDEPTSQLDPMAAQKFIHTIDKLNKDFGVTILISEQRMEEVFPLADKVLIMEGGAIKSITSPQKSGRILKNMNSPVYPALPFVTRLYTEFTKDDNCVSDDISEAPLTVRQGRTWLESLKENELREVKKLSENISKKVTECIAQKAADDITRNVTDYKKSESDIVLSAKGIFYSYEKKRKMSQDNKKVLKDFNINVPKGCIYAMLGGNGSGKTTALKILGGIYKAKRGRVKANGRVIYLPQNPQTVFTEITVRDELLEVYRSNRALFSDLSDEECEMEVSQMLLQMELEKYALGNPFDLSGGQMQRLALGKVLLLRPDVLLMDEPTKGIDAEFKEKLSEILQAMKNRGITIVMVSHDIEFCARNVDYCSLLFAGELTEAEDADAFFRNNYFYTTYKNRLFGK